MATDHWVETTLSDICSINPRHKNVSADTVTFVTMSDIDDNSSKFKSSIVRKYNEVRTGFTHFEEGDVLFAKITPCMENGKAAIAINLQNGIGCGTTELHILRPLGNISSSLIYHFIHQDIFRQEAQEHFTGSAGQQRVPVDFIKNHSFSLPPLSEQKRIVEKLDAILPKVKAAKQRLEKIPKILKRFRQSILAAACSGKLTEDFRNDETYDDDLPAGWKIMSMEKILPRGGIFDGPFGSNLKTSDYTGSGVRVIRLENIGQMQFVSEKKTYISHDKYASLKKHTVGEGDIIFASFIGDEVRACILPKLDTLAIAKADCFCIRPNKELIDSKYLLYQLVCSESYNKLCDDIHGATRPRVNTTQLRKLNIPVPPLEEQHEIVRRVEALFKLADSLEAKYNKAMARIEKIEQAVLAKAFRGELAAQDPTDEPAEELLKRILAEKAKMTATNKKRSAKVK